MLLTLLLLRAACVREFALAHACVCRRACMRACVRACVRACACIQLLRACTCWEEGRECNRQRFQSFKLFAFVVWAYFRLLKL